MWIEIFKTGSHHDSGGRERVFDAKLLDKISEQYNLMVELDRNTESPIVKGHPNYDSPAVGWIGKLYRRGEKLLGKAKFVSNDIIDEIKSGMFKNVSVSLGPDLELRHVALLGAANPAVKGLDVFKFAEFSDNTDDDIHIADNTQIASDTILNTEIDDFKSRISNIAVLLTPAQEKMIKEIADKISDEKSTKSDLFRILENIVNSMIDRNPVSEFAISSERKPRSSQFSQTYVNPERLKTHYSAEKMSINDNISYEEALNIIYFQNQ